MKKLILLTLALITMIGVLAACNSDSTAPSGGTPDSSAPKSSDTLSANEENDNPSTQQGRVINVVSPEFVLSDGFIEPIEKQTAAPDGFIPISTAEDFNKIRLNAAGKYILMDDIDLSSFEEWKYVSTGGTYLNFEGILDGNGFTVKGFETSLFQKLDGGVVQNLAVELNGRSMVNTAQDATIINCHSSGHVAFTGGVFNNQNGAGGIVSVAHRTTIQSCYNEAQLNVDGKSCIGGIAGNIRNVTIQNCYNTGNITASSAGGIAGGFTIKTPSEKNDSTISGCYNAGNILCSSFAYGIFGCGVGTGTSIDTCYNTGTVESASSGSACGISGGGISSDRNDISNCYNAGIIINSMEAPGGDARAHFNAAVGISDSSYAVVRSCYSIGQIEGYYAGGIGRSKDLENCYFMDNVESATPDGALLANVAKLTDIQMQETTSFAGFDFDNVWTMGDATYPYPVFKSLY